MQDNLNTIDIDSKTDGAGALLSNFFPYVFTFDNIPCRSMEGLLPSLKFPDSGTQRLVCQLTGSDAKKAGAVAPDWKERQTLYWQDRKFPRDSKTYQDLLDRIYNTLKRNKLFQTALLATGDALLVHSIGKTDPTDTILTIDELCQRLMRIRAELQREQSIVPITEQEFV